MAKGKELEFEKPTPVAGDEDKATLAGIDKRIEDAKANRPVTIAEVRKLLCGSRVRM